MHIIRRASFAVNNLLKAEPYTLPAAYDWTMYPFSSQNAQDFKNLMAVYLDAALFPFIRELDFCQEGWRLEQTDLSDQASPIVFKGVVYNEMKGAFSNSQSIYYQAALNSLLPSHSYGVVSGGHPVDIPKLTYEQLKKFHATHYHPSNAKFFTNGILPLENHLDYINSYLDKFNQIPPSESVPKEPRWDTPISPTFLVLILPLLLVNVTVLPATGKCLDEWVGFEATNPSCYYFSKETATWMNATMRCFWMGAKLVEINSEIEYNAIVDEMKKRGAESSWTGGTNYYPDKGWKWFPGSVANMTFTMWVHPNPSNSGLVEHCLEIDTNDHHRWNDIDCNNLQYYVCEKPITTC